jgi:hypothetical protein
LLLARFIAENKNALRLIAPAPNIPKDETGGLHQKYVQKRVKSKKTEREMINELNEHDIKTVRECFQRITEKWQLKFIQIAQQREVFFTRLSDDDDRIPLRDFWYEEASDGLRQIFRTVLHFPSLSEHKIICLDEPESHLHPRLYCSLIKELLQHLPKTDDPYHRPKLIIATHDFHLIDAIVRMSTANIRGLVMEMRLTPLPKDLDIAADTSKSTHRVGAESQLDEPLRSIISTHCISSFVFDANKNQESFVEYSSALMETMTYNAPIVLFCEGKPDSIDSKIYSLFFDPCKIDVQPAGGGYAQVRNKTLAAKNASDLLRAKRSYYGLCDRDRNLAINYTDVCMLPVAEVESIFWIPDMWPLYPDMLKQLDSYDKNDEIDYNNNTYKFWRAFRATICLNLYHYMCEYAIADLKHQTKVPVPNLIKTSRNDKSKLPSNVQQTMSLTGKQTLMDNYLRAHTKILSKFEQEWRDTLNYAFETSTNLEKAYESTSDLKQRPPETPKFPLNIPPINNKDAEKMTVDDLVVIVDNEKRLSPKHLLYAFFQLAGYPGTKDGKNKSEDDDVSLRDLYEPTDSVETKEVKEKNEKDDIEVAEQSVDDNSIKEKTQFEEPSAAFKKFFSILNEKDVLTILEETIFARAGFKELHKRKIVWVFEQLLNNCKDEPGIALRSRILNAVHGLFKIASYHLDTKDKIIESLLPYRQVTLLRKQLLI